MPQRSPKGDSTQRHDALPGDEPFSDETVNAGPPARRPPGGKAPRPLPASMARTAPSAPAQRRPAAPARGGGGGDDAGADDEAPPEDEAEAPDAGGDAEGAPADGFGSLLISVPKAVGYYLINVPKLLFNPIGTVRTSIEEQPAQPAGRWALMGYAIPSLLVTLLLGSIAGGIATLIAGGGFVIMAFIPIVPAVSAVVGGIVTGFIFHPVLGWLITKLKGTSDDRSRTNFFLNLMTVAIIVAVPNALGVILASVRLPFIGLLGPLLMTAASLVTIYVLYRWFVAFEVMQWIPKVILALGAIAVVFAGLGLVQGIIANVKALGSGGGSTEVAALPADAQEALAKAQAQADELAKKAQAQADEATKKAQGGVADAKDAPGDAPAAEKTPEAPKRPETVAKAPEPAAVDDAPPSAAPAADPAPAVEKPAAAEKPPAAPVRAGTAYAAFAHKREAIEHLLEQDPTVLDGNKALQELYGDYLKSSYDIERKYAKDIAKTPARAKLYQHLRDSELFRKTGKDVDELAAKLGVR